MEKIDYSNVLNKAFSVLRKKLWIVLLLSVLVVIGNWRYRKLFPAVYCARSVFYPDKTATLKGSPLELIDGSASARAGTLGILSKVLYSRLLTSKIAATPLPPTSSKKYKILADWILEDDNTKCMPWQKKLDINKLHNIEKIERAAAILRNGCFTIFDDNGFMSLKNNCYSEDLALAENKLIIKTLIEFNLEKKTLQAKEDLIYINHRTDSITQIYQRLKHSLAQFSDDNKYMIKQTVRLPVEDLEEEKQIISTRYKKLVEMQEQAFVRYETDKPIIDLLDEPYIDSVTKPDVVGVSIFYGIISAFFLCIFFTRKILFGLIQAELKRAMAKTKDNSSEGTSVA